MIKNKFYYIFIIILILSTFDCASKNALINEELQSITKVVNKGVFWYQKGCYKRALEYFLRAHEKYSVYDQLDGVAISLNNIGNVYRMMGDISQSLKYFDNSYQIYSEINNTKGALNVLSNKATALIENNEIIEAENVLKTAEQLEHKITKPFIPIIINKSLIYIKKKNFDKAKTLLKYALKNTSKKNPNEFASINYTFGKYLYEIKNYKSSIIYFNHALNKDREIGCYKRIADDLYGIAQSYLELNQKDNAINYFIRCAKIYALINNKEKALDILNQIKKIPNKTNNDMDISEKFINKWIDNHMINNFCNN